MSGNDTCSFGTISGNLSKNMFILMGKATSMAETFKDFPAPDTSDFKEQMREFGSDLGTALRVVFAFQTESDKEAEPAVHHSKYMPKDFNPRADNRHHGKYAPSNH